MERFGLGWAPEAWTSLGDAARAHGIPNELLLELGLVKQSTKGGREPYDAFRGRLIFPIEEMGGRVVAFGGRVIGEVEEHVPKYLNSPETPVYHKGNTLYGLRWSRGAIRRAESALVVEGYMDFVTLASHGVENAVAPLGTAMTPRQAELIARYAPQAVLLYDSDSAGLKATFRTADELLRAGVEVLVATLPDGEDPDSLVRARRGEGAAPLPAATPWTCWSGRSRSWSGARCFGSISGVRRAIDALLPSVRAASDEVSRGVYIARIAERTGVPASTIEREVAEAPARDSRPPPAPERRQRGEGRRAEDFRAPASRGASLGPERTSSSSSCATSRGSSGPPATSRRRLPRPPLSRDLRGAAAPGGEPRAEGAGWRPSPRRRARWWRTSAATPSASTSRTPRTGSLPTSAASSPVRTRCGSRASSASWRSPRPSSRWRSSWSSRSCRSPCGSGASRPRRGCCAGAARLTPPLRPSLPPSLPLSDPAMTPKTMDALETPAAVVDVERMRANLERVARYCREHGLAWRPHVKTHKTPELAREQLRAGAVGLTVATPAEAEVMSAAVDDLLLAYPTFGESKLRRLMELPERVRLTVGLDSAEALAGLAGAAREHGRTVGILVELDLGMHRVGVQTPEEAVALARRAVDAGAISSAA